MQNSFRYMLFILIGIAIAGLFFVTCVPRNAERSSDPNTGNSQITVPDSNNVDESESDRVLPPTVPQTPDSGTSVCGITSCHGLDIECGSDVPEMCTMEYRLGDFCRQFAECRVVQGECQFVENSFFMNCRSCVQDCSRLHTDDPMQAFECESQCRDQFESVAM